MKTPLELALAQLRGEAPDPHGPPGLTPLGAIRLWLQLFGLTFFGLFACSLLAIASSLSLLTPLLAVEHQPLGSFAGLMLLTLVYCLGNILLLQGRPGSRWVHSLLLATLLLIALALALIQPFSAALLVSLAACLIGLLLSNSKSYRAMQAVQASIRQLRRQHGLGRRLGR
jgi:hypothetical protein